MRVACAAMRIVAAARLANSFAWVIPAVSGRLRPLRVACAAMRIAAAVCLAGYFAAVIPAGWPVNNAFIIF